MKPIIEEIALNDRASWLKKWFAEKQHRLGLITSIDGKQLLTLVLDSESGEAVCLDTPLHSDKYKSLTTRFPQCHWHERLIWDLFGLVPEHHPRLKHILLHEPYDPALFPLRSSSLALPEYDANHRKYHNLEVKGNGVYELPVGPIHAGIIEPGHFRFSCLGEVILNLEIRLGYLHRGVEKRICEVDWTKARFVAEAAASDTAAANALAHAITIESLAEIKAPPKAVVLRAMALEIERTAMHIGDLLGFAGDIGFLGIAASFSHMRGTALRMGELLAGHRFLRYYSCPGGVVREADKANLTKLAEIAKSLLQEIQPVANMFLDTQVAQDRMTNVGKVSTTLARDFGIVGVAARACGINYDARQSFTADLGECITPMALEKTGDVLARAKIRLTELEASLAAIASWCDSLPEGSHRATLPAALPSSQRGIGVVEAHRGELIHLAITDKDGKICRYAIKDPSVNNWTALAIAIRNNLVADFPLCNKSFALAYSGHDL